MIRRPPRSTQSRSSAASDVYKRQAQAKYATELFLSSLKTINNQLHFSSLRLAALSGGANGLVAEADFLNKFVRNAIEGKRIKVIGGTQQIERLDIRDAVK